MSLRVAVTFSKGSDANVFRMTIPAGYISLKTSEQLMTTFIEEMEAVEAFLASFDKSIPDWDVATIHVSEQIKISVNSDIFMNVKIWRGMLREGVSPAHVLVQVEQHLTDLTMLPSIKVLESAPDSQEAREYDYAVQISTLFAAALRSVIADHANA